jgi:hypothetical protein
VIVNLLKASQLRLKKSIKIIPLSEVIILLTIIAKKKLFHEQNLHDKNFRRLFEEFV